MLGVSETHGFIMNSLAIPRKAKQAIGGIAKLSNAGTGQERYVVPVPHEEAFTLARIVKLISLSFPSLKQNNQCGI